MASIAYGRYLAGKVRMKMVTLELGLSWENVYARASVRAGRKMKPDWRTPPRNWLHSQY